MNAVAPMAQCLDAGYAALAAPRYELIPIRGMLEQAGLLPRGSSITVTCSPKHGIERTLESAELLAGMGYLVVPHLAARLVQDRHHLQAILERLHAAGMDEVFVIGGDAARPVGEFAGGHELLEAMAGLDPRPARVGIPAYPEGHALIDAATLEQALQAKSAFASYMVTQICFDPEQITKWLRDMAGRGPGLPVHIGLPGVMEPRRLLGLAMRIGIGNSAKVLRRSNGLFGHLLGGEYTPDDLVWRLAPLFDDPQLDLRGFHLNTFNQLEPLLRWRHRMLEAMAAWCSPAEPDEEGGFAADYGHADADPA